MFKNNAMVLALLLALTSQVMAVDYIAQRKDAMALLKSGKVDQALVVFQDLAKADVSEVQKLDAQLNALDCMLRLKQYEEAGQLIDAINSVPEATLSRMKLLNATRKWDQVYELAKGVTIEDWPASLQGDAYSLRGAAAVRQKDYELAKADLTKALDFKDGSNDKALAYNSLAMAYRAAGEDDKAIETYKLTLKAGQKFKATSAAVAIAKILIDQNKPDEAIAQLDAWDKEVSIDELAKISAVWPVIYQMTYAEALAAQGKTQEALARYKQALAIEGIAKGHKKHIEKAIEKLQP